MTTFKLMPWQERFYRFFEECPLFHEPRLIRSRSGQRWIYAPVKNLAARTFPG